MHKLLLGAALVAFCLQAAPVSAASAETEAFVANVRLDAAFLETASTLAADRSANETLRSFAAREADAEASVLSSIDRRSVPQVAQSMPMTLASNEVMTGRSVAVEPVPSIDTFAAPAGPGALMPAATLSLSHLAASKGHAFDALYKATQIAALRQLAGFYDAYALTGDDAGLRQMATSELAATRERIAAIARL